MRKTGRDVYRFPIGLSRYIKGAISAHISHRIFDTPPPYKGGDSTFNDSPLDDRFTPIAQEEPLRWTGSPA
ncbi:hypothetical protein H6G08_09785 [Calothrix anomala FACHB-343]|uniref:Uncharacterized protein n=1 Tax=Calothrix anomala FACHB-343 TaxID=2692894 RepID=A0ABR8AWA0_9CYAN|nr:hypothetical protein [Calothrix anomala FACHB-343]